MVSTRRLDASAFGAVLMMAAVAAAWPIAAQQPAPRGTAVPAPPTSSPDPEPSARIVRVDAVVLDAKGSPILDLKPSDFQVVEDGVTQRIDAAELRTPGRPDPPSNADASIESADDERRAAREQGTRLFALVLDEFHVSEGPGSALVRESARRFVAEQLRPADLLVVLKPLDSLTDIRFTRDRTRALQAIETFAGRQGDYTPRTEFEEKFIGRAPALVRSARVQIILSVLRALTMKLGELEAGRSAVVLVSEGFAREVGRDRERRLPDIQGIVRAASRHNVAVYTFDPGTAGAQITAAGTGESAVEPSAAMLRSLAAQTGGEAVFDPSALSAGLQRVARDLDAYYMLTYTSSHPTDGRFYDLQVRTTRRDAQVRARSGYWAPLRHELRAAADGPSKPVRALRHSPMIQTWLGLTVLPDGTQQVTFTWAPGKPRPGTRQIAIPSVVGVRITTPKGALLFDGEIRAPGEGVGVSAYPDAATFTAAPGRIQADLVIFAADGSRLDTAAHDIDVPDVYKGDPLILPPQVFDTRSARDFRELSRRADAAPVPAREFRRTERLLLRVPVHSSSGAEVTLKARLVNRWGQVLRELAPMDRASAGVTQFDLPLGWLAPGDYVIEFNATTPTGSAKEILRFKLTG